MSKGKGWLKDYFEPSVGNQHTCVYGVSGSGKTTLLDWFLLEHFKRKYNVIVRDIGKGSELSILYNNAPIRLFLFEGIKIRPVINEIEIIEFIDFNEVFTECKSDKINVVSIPYHTIKGDDRYGIYLNIWRDFFVTLIDMAFEYQIKTPGCLGIDELNNIAPSSYNLSQVLKTLLHELIIAFQELRGNQLKLMGTSMGISELNPYIRKQIAWHVFKKVAESPSKKLEFETLRGIDTTVKKLKVNQFILVNPNRDYSFVVEQTLNLKPSEIVYFTGRVDAKILRRYGVGFKQYDMLIKAIKSLIDCGLSQSKISKILGCSQSYISQLIS